MADQSLYDRLGGIFAIAAVIDPEHVGLAPEPSGRFVLVSPPYPREASDHSG